MKTSTNIRWAVFGASFVFALLAITLSHAANVNLIAYVSYSLLDSDGNPLQNGSWVGVFGSTDAVNDGPASWGGTNLIADSTLGDDVFLGWVYIGEPAYFGSNGTFYTANQITFDESVINYLYLRFFDTTEWPEGYLAWGTSDVYGFTSAFGQVTVDFVGNYVANMTNNFVIIPEPSTAHLMLLFLGLVAGMHSSFRRSKAAQKPSKTGVNGTTEKNGRAACLMG